MSYNAGGGGSAAYYNAATTTAAAPAYEQQGYYSTQYSTPSYDSSYYYGTQGYQATQTYPSYSQSYSTNTAAVAAPAATQAAPAVAPVAHVAPPPTQNQWAQYYPSYNRGGGRGGRGGGAQGQPRGGSVISSPAPSIPGKNEWRAPISTNTNYSGYTPRGRGQGGGGRGQFNRGRGRGGGDYNPGGRGGRGGGGYSNNQGNQYNQSSGQYGNTTSYPPPNYNTSVPQHGANTGHYGGGNEQMSSSQAPATQYMPGGGGGGQFEHRGRGGRGRGRGRGSRGGAFSSGDNFKQTYFPTLEEFFDKGMHGMHPTGWVSEQARRKEWVLSGKEGTEGTKYSYSLTIDDMTAKGVASKKKEAKNLAFRTMAVRMAEKLSMIPKQPTDVETKINEALHVEPKVVVLSDGKGPVETNTMMYNPAQAEIPEEIPKLNEEEVSSLPGKAVTLLTEELKRMGLPQPIFTCVNEERIGKGKSHFGRTEFTTKAKYTIGDTTYSYFGKALNKKDSKNQSACFAYLGILNKKIEDFSLKTPNDPLLQDGKTAPVIKFRISEGQPISVQLAGSPAKPVTQPVIKLAPRVVPVVATPAVAPKPAAASPVINITPKTTAAPATGIQSKISIGTMGATKVVPVASVPPQKKDEAKSEDDSKKDESFDDSSYEFSLLLPKKDKVKEVEKSKDRKRSRSRSSTRSRSRSRGRRSRSSSRERSSKYRKRSSSRDRKRDRSRGRDSGYKSRSSYRDRSSSRDRRGYRR